MCFGRLTLLKAIMIQAGCTSSVELAVVSKETRRQLAISLTRVKPELATIEEWNAVLRCFADVPMPKTSVDSKKALIDILQKNST